nr:reverse transcriptase family protein [Motilibacter aurantiacus]
MGQLEWLADARGLLRRAPQGPLHHYRYRWQPKAGGARLLEAPLPRLRRLQRTLLDTVLARVPVHPAAHGYVPGRSAVTNAAAHVGAAVVVSLDLEAFFSSLSAGRAYGVLRTAGYPEPVAHLLTALCTNAVPVHVLRGLPDSVPVDVRFRLRRALATPHLPQGAPTSPTLANLCAHALDRRLAGYAAAAGVTYTRYADDLTFSGGPGLLRAAPALVTAVRRIAAAEGHRVNVAKTRVRSSAQRQVVTGLVVNERLNLPRGEYDRLKAVVHDAVRHGPAAANRHGHRDFRAHLEGRVAWLEAVHPERGARLRAQLARVAWPVS